MATNTARQRRWGVWIASVSALAVTTFAWAFHLYGLPRTWVPIVIFGSLLLFSDKLVLELPGSMAVGPSSVLTLAAVAALPPHDRIVGAMIVGACDGIEWKRLRARRFHIVLFNSSQLALTALVASVVYDAFSGSAFLQLLGTSVAAQVGNFILVTPAVALKSGQKPLELLAETRFSTLTEVIFGLFGLIVGRLYHSSGLLVVLLVIAPAVLARIVSSSVVRFRHAYDRLESLYDFTRELETSRSDPDPATSMLHHVSSRLGVRGADVVLVDEEGWHRASLRDGQSTREEGQGAVPAIFATHVPRLLGDDPAIVDSAHAADLGLTGGMVAPLRVDGRLIGTLAVAGNVILRPLTQDDLKLLETLANHVAVFLERNRLVERLRHDSYHDQLTGLPNRRRFTELIEEAERPTSILLVDLDRFKEVNDTLGHDHGDALLVSVADRLRQDFGGSVVARLGGDEFGVLLPGTGAGDAAQAALALLSAIEQPFGVDELDLEITGSIGVATATDDEGSAKLLQQADVAMYAAKEAHSGWEMYDARRDHYSPWRLSLASDLRRGITDGELEVHFQPKARLSDGEVSSLEALVRWRHPRYGLLSPDQFVPVAEHAGLIRPLTMAVLSAACEQHTSLRARGFSLGIAVNLSVRSVLDVNLPDQVEATLSTHAVDPRDVTLEITEGSLMADPARTIGVLGRLAALGISISIDDFGTGYSSLGYLKRLPAGEVKIDRSFVSGMLTNASDEAIVRSTVDLAHNLGLRAVAEGVEDPETWDRLAAMGCDEGQGYYLSAPLAAEALLPWLLRTRSTDPHT